MNDQRMRNTSEKIDSSPQEYGGSTTLTEEQRERGQRPDRASGRGNIMLAGAMGLTLMCGLALLVLTATRIVPQARERMRPTPEPVLYVATLWCLPCEQAGSLIVLWERVGDGVSRGEKTGELPHHTTVKVLAEEWSAPEQRTYLKVVAEGQKGWIPATFIKD